MSLLLYRVVDAAFTLYTFLILVRCILSWFPIQKLGPILSFIYELTEPVLAPFRRLFGTTMGIDFSPVIAVFVVELIRDIILRILL